MSIRLLPKREIDQKRAVDRKREVDEGKKLAERVDSLREMASKEESNLTKFRDESLKRTQEEINTKLIEKEVIEQQISEKRGEMLSLSGDIDKAWMFYVKTEKAEIERLQADLRQKNTDIDLKSTELSQLQQDAKTAQFNFEALRNETIIERNTAQNLVIEAKETLENAKNKSHQLITQAEKRDELSIERHTNSAVREANVKIKEESLAKKEDELETREMNVLAKELLYYSPVRKNN